MADSRYPVLLKGAAKDYLWGGRRLIEEYGRLPEEGIMAEYWGCSTHPDGISTAAGGPFEGMELTDILAAHPEYFGTNNASDAGAASGQLPILVKLIDAMEDLSIQVHPDDAFAAVHENGGRGKNEFWYILDAEPGAELIYGFYDDVAPAEAREALQNGTIGNYVQRVPVSRNDLFYVEAGTVHAVCRGIILAEIQESSNLTYRMYDYGRRDKNGKPRELHLDRAMQVMRLTKSPQPRQPMRLIRYIPGIAEEFLFRCAYFEVHRLLLSAETGSGAPYRSGETSFEVLLCIDGEGTITAEGMERIRFYRGDFLFVPAGSVPLRLNGKASFLRIHC